MDIRKRKYFLQDMFSGNIWFSFLLFIEDGSVN